MSKREQAAFECRRCGYRRVEWLLPDELPAPHVCFEEEGGVLNEDRCDWELAGYEKHSGHRCTRRRGHEGRHRDEHGVDGGWRKIGSHLA